MKKTPRKNPERAHRLVWLVALVALFAGPLRALDPIEWKNRQTLRVDTAGVATVELPDETLDAARLDLGDLRIVDPAGQEIAFAVVRAGRPPVQSGPAKSFRSQLGATSTQIVVECDAAPAELTLLTPETEFVKRARIETSADGRTWQSSQDDVPFFRQAGTEQLSLRTDTPFVRIILDDTRSRPAPFTGARVTPLLPPPADTQPVPVRIARRDEYAGETVLTLELAAAHGPLDELTLTTPERLFTRRVTVGTRELKDSSAVERALAAGTILRGAVPTKSPAWTSVTLGFDAPSRELLVHIANGDSPPLAITGVALSRLKIRLRFDAGVAGEYALLSGHAQVPKPRYDIARLSLEKMESTAAPILQPGPLTTTPGYRAPDALAGASLLGAPLDPAAWMYRKTVRLERGGVHQLELDAEVLAHALPGLEDLRLLRDGAQVPYLIERPALSHALTLPLVPASDPARPRIGRWELTLPYAGLPLRPLTITSPTALFQRQLQVFEKITDDRGNTQERTLAFVSWSRTPGENAQQSQTLIVPLNGVPATNKLIIETDNGDNPPLALSGAQASLPVVRLLFKADAGSLALYYGNRATVAPRYDLALMAGQVLAAEKSVAGLAPAEKLHGDGWQRTMFASGRGGILFWGVLALVVAVLLAVVAKLLPKPPK